MKELLASLALMAAVTPLISTARADTSPAADSGTAPPQNMEPISPDKAIPVLGKEVVSTTGEKMGPITDIVVDQDAKPIAAVIDFGGFLGVGTRKIAVNWGLLTFRPGDKNAPIVLNLTRDQVKAAPEYKETVAPAMVGPTPAAPANAGN